MEYYSVVRNDNQDDFRDTCKDPHKVTEQENVVNSNNTALRRIWSEWVILLYSN